MLIGTILFFGFVLKDRIKELPIHFKRHKLIKIGDYNIKIHRKYAEEFQEQLDCLHVYSCLLDLNMQIFKLPSVSPAPILIEINGITLVFNKLLFSNKFIRVSIVRDTFYGDYDLFKYKIKLTSNNKVHYISVMKEFSKLIFK